MSQSPPMWLSSSCAAVSAATGKHNYQCYCLSTIWEAVLADLATVARRCFSLWVLISFHSRLNDFLHAECIEIQHMLNT